MDAIVRAAFAASAAIAAQGAAFPLEWNTTYRTDVPYEVEINPAKIGAKSFAVKADGRLMVIDGGLSKAYQGETGIAGYTLVYHSRGFELIQHEPFTSTSVAVSEGTDIRSSKQIVELSGRRLLVRDTDKGRELKAQIAELQQLLYAYRHGILKERNHK